MQKLTSNSSPQVPDYLENDYVLIEPNGTEAAPSFVLTRYRGDAVEQLDMFFSTPEQAAYYAGRQKLHLWLPE